MDRGLGYHQGVRTLWASVVAVLFAPLLSAQINGVPPSVTSFSRTRPHARRRRQRYFPWPTRHHS